MIRPLTSAIFATTATRATGRSPRQGRGTHGGGAHGYKSERAVQFRSACNFDGLPESDFAQATRRGPYDANDVQHFRTSHPIKGVRDRASVRADYKPIRLFTAGAESEGKSSALHALTDLVRNLLGPDGAAVVYAPTDVAAFHFGGAAGGSSRNSTRGEEIPAARATASRTDSENCRGVQIDAR